MGSSSSRPDTAATNRDVDYLLLDGRISNADVRGVYGWSGLHLIPVIGRDNEDVDTDMLISYLLTCDPPADVNGRDSIGSTPMRCAAYCNNTSAVKVLIDFGGDRTIKTNSNAYVYANMTPLDIAKKYNNNQEIIQVLTECFPSEE
jgi:ankyrin repeat protein